MLPRRRISELHFEENRALLEPFMEAIASLGRLPDVAEFPGAAQVVERFGSLKRALAFVQRVGGFDDLDRIGQRRREDMLVYLALARFDKQPALSQLPRTLQRDMRAFFGSYAKACAEAYALLFKAGDAVAVDEACRLSAAGLTLRGHRVVCDN